MVIADTSDPRVERSRTRITEGLAALLRSHEGRDITVSALCTEAGVSRPTFYQHFASVDAVAVTSVEQRFARLHAELPAGPEAPYRILVAFLCELEAERASWRRTIGCRTAFASTRDAVETWLADRLAERWPAADPAEVRYAAAGFLGAVRAWLLTEDGPGRPDAERLAETLAGVSTRVLGAPEPCPSGGSGS